MTRNTLAIAALAWTALACGDRSGSLITDPTLTPPSQPIQPAPSLATVAGRVVVTGSADNRAVNVRIQSGDLVRLVGSEAAAIFSVDGADISVRGTWDANPGLVVQDFQVLAMKGRPAMDGILELTASGCALRLADGTLRVVPGDAENGNIRDFVGLRLWVIGSDTERPVEFGVIAPI